MTHGLFIGSEKCPVETGTREELRKIVRHMTPKQLRDGWRIQPLDPWPALKIERPSSAPHPVWIILGACFVTAVIVILCNVL